MKTNRIFFAVLFGSGLIYLAILLNVWEPLRGDYGWRWPYSAPYQLDQWLPSFLGIFIYLGGGIILLNRPVRWRIFLWAYLGCAILPFVFLSRWDDPFFSQFTRVVSGTTSGPQLIAMEYTPETVGDNLKNWTEEQERFADDHISIHAALAPPGLPLLYYGVGQTLEKMDFLADPIGQEFRALQCDNLELAKNSNAELASGMVGILSPLWAGLAIFPLYWLAKKLTEDEILACGAVLLWALVAGVAVFTPVPNTVFPTLSLLVIACLWKGLEKSSLGWALISGIFMSALTFLNISVIPLILLCGFLALGYHLFIAKGQPWFWSIQIGSAFGLGLSSIWLIWGAYGGDMPWEMLQTAMSQHLELERPYFPWLGLHLWDYGLFLGLPVFFLGVWGFGLALWQVYHERRLSPLQLLAFCLGLALLSVDVSGSARGETGRVWQFFFPFHLTSILSIIKLNPKISTASWDAAKLSFLLIAQGFATFVVAVYLNVIGTGLAMPPQSPPLIDTPNIQVETQARFGESLNLTGFGGKLDENKDLVVDLRWQTDDWQVSPYYFAILPIAPDGMPYGESFVYQPFETAYPATCWQPNQIIIERNRIPLGEDAPQGEWWLSISVHNYETYQPLMTWLPDGTTDQQVGIGGITLE